MNRRIEILLHIAVWAVLFLAPLSFISRSYGSLTGQFLMAFASPLMTMLVFYLNYMVLTSRMLLMDPSYPQSHHVYGKRYYLTTNAVLCIVLGILLHLWMTFCHEVFDDPEHRMPTLTLLQTVLIILRNILALALAAAIATTIQLSLRWFKSEEARRDAEAARTEAELRNLRNQISPHFLLNTLNNIYALTAFDVEKAQSAIEQLSMMLRHMLYDNQQEEVEWDKEVKFLESYVNLMKIRLPQSADVTFSAQCTDKGVTVAPLLFISLIENAFKHGVSPTEPCFIHIRLEARDGQITCDIENSYHPKSATDQSGHGIGLQQVERRLELNYPGRYLWQKSVGSDGTTYRSTITITH